MLIFTRRGVDMLEIRMVGGDLAVTTPYDATYNNLFKAIVPATKRKYDPNTRRWLVSADQGPLIQRLIEHHFHIRVDLPVIATTSAQPLLEIRLLEVRYLGATKPREDSSESAFGYVNDQWSAIFPKKVLLTWFGRSEKPDEAPTLYAVLGIGK